MTDRVGFGKPAGGCDQVAAGLCRRASPLLPPPVSSCCLALRSSLFSVPTLPLRPATSGGSVSLSSPFCSVSALSLGVALLVQLLRFFFLCHCRSLLPSFLLWRPNFLRWCCTSSAGAELPLLVAELPPAASSLLQGPYSLCWFGGVGPSPLPYFLSSASPMSVVLGWCWVSAVPSLLSSISYLLCYGSRFFLLLMLLLLRCSLDLEWFDLS